MFMPRDVGGSYGFRLEMHFILLDRVQDRVVKQITSWSLCCLSACHHGFTRVMACCQGDEASRGRGLLSSLWKR